VQTTQVASQRKPCAVFLPTAECTRVSTLFLVILTLLTCFPTGCSRSDNSPAPKNVDAIQHTVFIISENHTFDNYFGTFPGADGATSGLLSNGEWIPLSAMPDAYQGVSLCNSWDCALVAMDQGKMDNFD
jgi:hypothetical protein